MAESNGQQDNVSRLDRIEVAITHLINEHEEFVDDHKFLLRAQVVEKDRIDKLEITVGEIGGKLDALLDIVDRDHREFQQKLKLLENRQ